MFQPKAIREDYDHDSDDSMEEGEGGVEMKVDLENRGGNWSAYLETFDESNSIRSHSPHFSGHETEEIMMGDNTAENNENVVDDLELQGYDEYPPQDNVVAIPEELQEDMSLANGHDSMDYCDYPLTSEQDDELVTISPEVHQQINPHVRRQSELFLELSPLRNTRKSFFGKSTDFNNDGGTKTMEQEVLEYIRNKSQDISTIKDMLEAFPELCRAMDDEGRTPLHLACMIGSIGLVELLLSLDARLDMQDYQGQTPLHLAGTVEMVRYLCQRKAMVDVSDIDGITPLRRFVQEENVEAVVILLNNCASPMKVDVKMKRNCIHTAALLGNYTLLMALVNESKHSLVFDQQDVEGYTALHLAATGDRETGEHLKIIMLLLDKEASVNLGNNRGITALHLLCANRMLHNLFLAEPIVEMLLHSGADPNARDADGCTPLIVSVAYREWNVCKMLLEAGGDLNISCSMSSTFLQGGNGIVEVESPLARSKENRDMKTVEVMTVSDCTSSDLMPKSIRYGLYGSIRVLQSRIPGATRDRCMNCANFFHQNSGTLTSYLTSGRHHCRHCNRVVCKECSPHEVSRMDLPKFVQETYTDSSLRLCVVCYAVHFDKTPS